ncbi:MAG: universal stress protein [Desulfobacterales bacterium]|jgi:nucleotide-binding universal stress UspA family protein
MEPELFHIWRNTPLGRETLLQSLYFCKTVSCSLTIYIPRHTKFLMYFDNDVVQIDLDESYLTHPNTAHQHAAALAEEAGIKPSFLEPKNYTASTLPDIPTHFDFMCCPRSISDLSSKIGLGYIGPRVRRIVQSARFPVLLTSPAYKPWSRIVVFFGGSANAVKALRLGLSLSRRSRLPLEIFTQLEKNLTRSDYEKIVEQARLTEEVEKSTQGWHFFESGEFEENLYNIPHDALVVLGAYGHSLIRDFVFGSKLEMIQSEISNNLLIAGPNATTGL